ncbi:uncharacterized protein N7515_003325 [Penicillium bovifimosum]|uniref:UDP-N-acetylglucosamine transferase subunit ALG13 n=1 Tax=Penicillium bovifimosum TaxID=126998 RepID=A0A9W9L647_9EURO|nr:uncharacterized protein N7515_003325 [Penicillium bovifimosum]KAJ5138477.1 hypothetical protein N7515_003325 [Penicillium bovifimosum]
MGDNWAFHFIQIVSFNSVLMKLCFVTVGATAAFRKLLEQVLTSKFTKTLTEHGYTHFLVQYGKDGQDLYDKFVADEEAHNGLTIGGFDFQPSIDSFLLQTVERKVYDRERGLIICHAGTGTILAGLRLGVPMIVVPNPDLADNHQQELADVLEEDKYVVSSSVENVGSAIRLAESQKAEVLSSRAKDENLTKNLSDEMGFLD